MCVSIDVHGGPMVHTIGELRKLVAPSSIKEHWLYDPVHVEDDESCLCPVDVVNTLIDAGYKVWRDPRYDPMMYTCERVDAERDERNRERAMQELADLAREELYGSQVPPAQMEMMLAQDARNVQDQADGDPLPGAPPVRRIGKIVADSELGYQVERNGPL